MNFNFFEIFTFSTLLSNLLNSNGATKILIIMKIVELELKLFSFLNKVNNVVLQDENIISATIKSDIFFWQTFVVSVLPVPAGPAGAPPNLR